MAEGVNFDWRTGSTRAGFSIHNNKGIISPVTINGTEISDWAMYKLPMDKMPSFASIDKGKVYANTPEGTASLRSKPVLYEGIFILDKVGDTFIDMGAWGKGIIFINGKNIGRYWQVGPQQTLYIPGVWLKKGENKIVIFEQINRDMPKEVATVKVPVLKELKSQQQNQSNAMYDFKQFGNKYIVSVKNQIDVVRALTAFCSDRKIQSGSISGLGAASEMTLRFFDPIIKKSADKVFKEQMEIANLTGNVSSLDGKTYLHLHVTAGRADYSTIAGRLLSATLCGAGEFVVEDFGDKVERSFSPEIGLNIYDFAK